MSNINSFIYNSSRDVDHIITAITQSKNKCFLIVSNSMIQQFFIKACPAIASQVLTLKEIELFRDTSEPYSLLWHDSVVSLATKELLTTNSTNDFMD